MSERYTPPDCAGPHRFGCACREGNLANAINTGMLAQLVAYRRSK